MKIHIAAFALVAGLAASPASAQEFELRVPFGWGDLTKSDFCKRVEVPGQSACTVDPVVLFENTVTDVTSFKARGTAGELESLLKKATVGDFFPFPWSDKLQQYSEMMSGFNFDPSDLPLTANACAVVNVAPGCTCIDKPMGGYSVVCDDKPGAASNFSVPPLPLGQLRKLP